MPKQTFTLSADDSKSRQRQSLLKNKRKKNTNNGIEHLLPKALEVYKTILQSEDASMDMKFKAAKAILDHSSASSKKPSPDQDTPYSIISSMSLEELVSLRSEVQDILAGWKEGRAKQKL